ncbi:hypothetical protein ECRM12581_8465 [Escherichia coli O145:H28 str. RM12581]|uniref:Mannitol-1-phosphate 5-dehydrogenase n=1 Tax=Escherichia coli O145:H28 (strain RM12581) TaxID=1248823 RepID=A0ABC7ZR30_ECOLR|nr:hypothetical protein ECRM13514_1719 [Escherichia coli O145:H28 str. RM13514]AHY70223.1 hypothetical protein ECRM12581_8465 [Escherichia coli O145:H28 str. RM12581]
MQAPGQYRCPDKAFTPHPAKNDALQPALMGFSRSYLSVPR